MDDIIKIINTMGKMINTMGNINQGMQPETQKRTLMNSYEYLNEKSVDFSQLIKVSEDILNKLQQSENSVDNLLGKFTDDKDHDHDHQNLPEMFDIIGDRLQYQYNKIMDNLQQITDIIG